MWGSFGELTFYLINTPTTFTANEEGIYPEHDRMDNKPVLQWTGWKLRRISMDIVFHFLHCEPSEKVAQLQIMLDTHAAYPLVLPGAGMAKEGDKRGNWGAEPDKKAAGATYKTGTKTTQKSTKAKKPREAKPGVAPMKKVGTTTKKGGVGQGNYEGEYVLKSIRHTVKRTDKYGNLLWVKVSIELLECLQPVIGKEVGDGGKKRTMKKPAFAIKRLF